MTPDRWTKRQERAAIPTPKAQATAHTSLDAFPVSKPLPNPCAELAYEALKATKRQIEWEHLARIRLSSDHNLNFEIEWFERNKPDSDIVSELRGELRRRCVDRFRQQVDCSPNYSRWDSEIRFLFAIQYPEVKL